MYGVFAPPLKECENATYRHRIDDPDNYNFCVVPHTGYDALLFAGIAIIAACVLRGKFSALYVLLAGALCQVLAFPLNLGRFGNSLALWLGIEPADIFLYVFLPPMLLDSAVRIEFFIFKKMLMHVVCFAFLIVMFSTAIYTPLLLYAFGLVGQGWTWQHAALFAAMIASTDAVAVSAILKSGGGPERMVVLMEGESLFNDATSIVLFEIFFGAVKDLSKGRAPEHGGLLEHIQTIVFQIVWLAAGGAAIGYAFGLVTRLLFKFLHRRTGHSAPEQLALTLGMAYLCFYLANGPGKVSGVIAVVVFGLHGSATAVWGMSAKVVESGSFDVFWDTLSFALNGNRVLLRGASSVNFFLAHQPRAVPRHGQCGSTDGKCSACCPCCTVAMLAVLAVLHRSFQQPALVSRLVGWHRGTSVRIWLCTVRVRACQEAGAPPASLCSCMWRFKLRLQCQGQSGMLHATLNGAFGGPTWGGGDQSSKRGTKQQWEAGCPGGRGEGARYPRGRRLRQRRSALRQSLPEVAHPPV
eukprot:jgi/Botrbrau1/1141/Bobra.0162s0032.1